MPHGRQVADFVFHNGKVLTVDARDSVRQAIAIQGESIQAVGSDRDILPLAGSGTTVVDLRGRTVIPGIVDIHAHMDREGLKAISPSLAGARSIPEILAIVQREVERASPGEWVVTMPVGDPPNYTGVPQSLAEGRFPTRWDLDQVSPHNPVYLRGIWTPWNVPPSVGVANSIALHRAGIDRGAESPDPSVTIERDGDGEPTGVLVDNNRFPTLEFTLMKVLPRFTHAQRVESLKESMRLYNSVGTTGIYEGHGVASEVLSAYKEVWDSGQMTVRSRLVLSPTWNSATQAQREMEGWSYTASGRGFGDGMLQLSGYFIEYQGERYASRARSSGLPYTEWAGFAESYNPPVRFRRLVRLAANYDLRVNTLVRRSLEEVLSIFEELHTEVSIDQRRWTLVHVGHTTHDQLRRIRRLGLVMETIPLTELWLRGSGYVDRPDQAGSLIAHRDYLEHHVPFGFGTDNKPYNPFLTLWAAVVRQERHTGKVLGPSQRLDRMEALRAFTMGGAYFSFDEGLRGSLEQGKLADLAVLSGDFLDMPETALSDLHSVLTMVGGRVVYESGDL